MSATDDARTSTASSSSSASALAVDKLRHATRQLKVLYVHGLESGPRGAKAELLRREGFNVLAPDMNPAIVKLKSVTRNPWLTAAATFGALDTALLLWLLKARRFALAALACGVGAVTVLHCFRRAVRLVMDECLVLQRRAIGSFEPDVVVGSSWGGAVVLYLVLRMQWRGPTLLLAPAQTKVHGYAQYPDLPRRLTLDGGDERVRRSSSSLAVPPFPLHVIHGRADTRVPLHHSERVYGRLPYAVLERVDDGHNLMRHCTGAVFRDRIERLYHLGQAAKAGVSAAALAYAATSAPQQRAEVAASAPDADAAAAAASGAGAGVPERSRSPSLLSSTAAAVRSADAPLSSSWVLVHQHQQHQQQVQQQQQANAAGAASAPAPT